ncbi:MAG TPA: hypothetical protein VM571_14675, partial [Noviherbaspirillum sp.]|nr:hypothetical protein [Noviherbaspirillum sp.]
HALSKSAPNAPSTPDTPSAGLVFDKFIAETFRLIALVMGYGNRRLVHGEVLTHPRRSACLWREQAGHGTGKELALLIGNVPICVAANGANVMSPKRQAICQMVKARRLKSMRLFY